MYASLRWILPALLLTLAACDSISTVDDDGGDASIALTALTCDVDGVNADPFTAADALAENAADHEVATDYTYDAATATTVALNGTSATVTGSGATASGCIVTVSAPGTYVVSGTLSDGQIVVDSPDHGAVKLVLDGATITSSTDSGIRVDEGDKTVLILAVGATNAVTGGTLALRSGGGASVTPGDASTKGFKAGVMAGVDDGALAIDASDDGVHSDGTVVVNGGTVEIATADAAVHSELDLTINGGEILVTRSYEGIEAVLGDLVVNGGTVDVTATDDGFNLSGDGDDPGGVESEGDPYDMVFKGGRITVASGNDSIDSAGPIVMTGGCLAIDGPTPGTQPEQGAIDYNGDFEITGGVLVAAGAAGRMAQTPSAYSSQPTVAVTFSSSQAAGTVISLQDSGSALAMAPGKAFQSFVVSAPWLSTGDTVTLYRGGTVSGGSTSGLFDGGTVSRATLLESATLSSIITAITS
ncbi:carbohydrate-binding domain-containing protein [Rubrivirga sp. S365]|uniref:carbohydrate-binding domain-containing protein n=1 Tax=Rubrivirga sp. S365 TaxID=3076080 RepID=UPI0028C5545E|nr:carbohydrate-binding domain-containing protein [Rubrivirga sp. S365]MDT7858380.1 carbohydrate-binding domain-containing protein [Rubrivirga sp. S365]